MVRRRKNKQESQSSSKRSRKQSSSSKRIPTTRIHPRRSRPEPETPAEKWWAAYDEADGPTRVGMTREKLATISPADEDFESFYPEAVDELKSKLPLSEYVEYLEELEETHPRVFAMDASWRLRSMLFEYVDSGREELVPPLVDRVANLLEARDAPDYANVSFLRLAGFSEAAQQLVDALAAVRHDDSWSDVGMQEWRLAPRYRSCAAAGVSEAGVDEIFQYAQSLGCRDDDDDLRDRITSRVAHLAGEIDESVDQQTFAEMDADAWRSLALLIADYQRWLERSRGVNWTAADEFRNLLVTVVNRIECTPAEFLMGITQRDLEPLLVGRLSFMSLEKFHAPAMVIAIGHFYDFLEERGIIDDQARRCGQSVCRMMWGKLRQRMEPIQAEFRFLERWLPEHIAHMPK